MDDDFSRTDQLAASSGVPRELIEQAKKEFEYASKHFTIAYRNWFDDYKFGWGDEFNGYQWPNTISRSRIEDQRPAHTINKTNQHCMEIINRIKKNRPRIKVKPTGGGASVESAQALRDLIRHMEYECKATDSYDWGCHYSVFSGLGFIQLKTEYDGDTFDQKIKIVPIRDVLGVYLDPDAQEFDKQDGNFAFIFTEMNKQAFDRQYPKYRSSATMQSWVGDYNWVSHDSVRIAEYYRRVKKKDKLFAMLQPDGSMVTLRESMMKDGNAKATLDGLRKAIQNGDSSVKVRDIDRIVVEYYKLVGNTIITEETTEWVGSTIPIIPVIGKETHIEGRVDFSGQVRPLLSPQRMYNYWSSCATEFGALQTKTPWLVPVETLEEYETYWNTANVNNHSVLPYKGVSDDGTKLDQPTRIEPPVAAPVAVTGMQITQNEFIMATGQGMAQSGQNGPSTGGVDRSAAAVDDRQDASDNAIFHYKDNLGRAIEAVGRIVLEIIPKIYDTKRTLMAMADDGGVYEILVDPRAQQSIQTKQAADQNAAQQVILNPNVGKYMVEIDSGPSYGTKREETYRALSVILTQAPQLTAIIGDLLLKSSDFELADEAAARLRRMVPSQALGQGPTMQEQALQAQVQNLTKMLSEAMEQLAIAKISLKGKDERREVDIFDAFTKRLDVILRHAEAESGGIAPDQLQEIVRQAIEESLGATMAPAEGATKEQLQPSLPFPEGREVKPPFPGARMGAGGGWYARDYASNKSYRRVM